ncbi:hypothetical protein [Rhodanobacter sp. PCA2]|uniref:hypothetical protein n=1 Tax=Rhodanobacter sp. PCA2 TaxID=2006117 RepID=UPI0015E7CC1E|nr:hypothetical protein [Rhodanobacter sp. PCA2]MBA2077754.1 hypothetical protein [Rhodanobacter sp. PCA2]
MTDHATEPATASTVRAQAIGMLAGTGFGGIWAMTGLAGRHGGYASLLGLVALAVLAALVVAALDLWRIARHAGLPQAPADGRNRHTGRGFLLILVAEIVAMNLAAWVLYPRHMACLMPAIALIVGLHFVPLAALLRRRHLYIAAIAMSLAGLAGVAAIALGADAATVHALLGAACALALWTTCFLSWRSTKLRLASRAITA